MNERPYEYGTRYARVCPQHKRVLDEHPGDKMTCPEGDHPVAVPATLDRHKGTLVHTPIGEEVGEARMNQKQPEPQVGRPKKQGVLDRAKFGDDKGSTLFLRLERKKGALIVRWQQYLPDDRGTTSGGLAVETDDVTANQAFQNAIALAVANGWKRQALVWGQSIRMAPLPKANAADLPPKRPPGYRKGGKKP